MNKRLLLDTNVLLTGLFAPQSKSFQIIMSVIRREITGYVIQNAIDEAERAIIRAAKQTGVNLLTPFRDAVKESGLIILPLITRDEGREFAAIKGTGDKALAAAAMKISATICTNDISDFKHSDRYGLTACTPIQLTHDGTIGLHTVCTGILATPNSGSFYIEFGSLNWANITFPTSSIDKFYLFDAEQIGGCYFEACSHSFIFQADNGPRLSVPHRPVRPDTLKMIVSYDCNSGTTIFMGDMTSFTSSTTWLPMPLSVGARTYIGCNRNGINQLSGCIKSFYGIPYPVNSKAAKNMISGNVVSNPWERLSLETMIGLLGLAG